VASIKLASRKLRAAKHFLAKVNTGYRRFDYGKRRAYVQKRGLQVAISEQKLQS